MEYYQNIITDTVESFQEINIDELLIGDTHIGFNTELIHESKWNDLRLSFEENKNPDLIRDDFMAVLYLCIVHGSIKSFKKLMNQYSHHKINRKINFMKMYSFIHLVQHKEEFKQPLIENTILFDKLNSNFSNDISKLFDNKNTTEPINEDIDVFINKINQVTPIENKLKIYCHTFMTPMYVAALFSSPYRWQITPFIIYRTILHLSSYFIEKNNIIFKIFYSPFVILEKIHRYYFGRVIIPLYLNNNVPVLLRQIFYGIYDILTFILECSRFFISYLFMPNNGSYIEYNLYKLREESVMFCKDEQVISWRKFMIKKYGFIKGSFNYFVRKYAYNTDKINYVLGFIPLVYDALFNRKINYYGLSVLLSTFTINRLSFKKNIDEYLKRRFILNQ